MNNRMYDRYILKAIYVDYVSELPSILWIFIHLCELNADFFIDSQVMCDECKIDDFNENKKYERM